MVSATMIFHFGNWKPKNLPLMLSKMDGCEEIN
jgi:hypothetical protein